MAKKKPRQRPAVTAERFRRLHALVDLLSTAPRTRPALLVSLAVDVRAFYRDLGLLRASGIAITMRSGVYALGEPPADAVAKLPFPDPLLTLGEARALARGKSPPHASLAAKIATLTT